MGSVKTQFTRINEIWCWSLEKEDLSQNVRKTQDRTSLTSVFWDICCRYRMIIFLKNHKFTCMDVGNNLIIWLDVFLNSMILVSYPKISVKYVTNREATATFTCILLSQSQAQAHVRDFMLIRQRHSIGNLDLHLYFNFEWIRKYIIKYES